MGFVVCAALSLAGLDMLARVQLQRHFDRAASETLGLLVHGETPHRWSAGKPADIIAARAFGSESWAFGEDGLRVHVSDQSIEIGFVLKQSIDLRRYSQFEARFVAGEAATVSLLVAETLSSSVCRTSPIALDRHAGSIRVDLGKQSWRCDNAKDKVADAPARAAMFRLRLSLPAGTDFLLRSAELAPSRTLSAADLDRLRLPVLPSPREFPHLQKALKRIASETRRDPVSVYQLPMDGRVEQVLAARDQIFEALPDTILVAKDDFPQVRGAALNWTAEAPRRAPGWLTWALLGGLTVLLLGIRLKPPLGLRARALIELFGVLVAPVVLVGGGYIGDDIGVPAVSACVLTFVFAVSLLFGDAPAQPGARTFQRGLWVAVVSLVLAVSLILLVNHGRVEIALPSTQHGLRYLAWAGLQQFLICVIVAGRIERVCGSRNAALLIAALIFALLHTPNAMLMQLTYLGALIWIWNWQRHRALLANIFAHAASGLLLAANLPPQWLHSAEVSARYFVIGMP